MTQKAILIERMIRLTTPKYTIRIWKNEPLEYEYTPEGVSEFELIALRYEDLSMRELVDKLLEVDGVNAVECLDWNLNGIVAYSNW